MPLVLAHVRVPPQGPAHRPFGAVLLVLLLLRLRHVLPFPTRQHRRAARHVRGHRVFGVQLLCSFRVDSPRLDDVRQVQSRGAGAQRPEAVLWDGAGARESSFRGHGGHGRLLGPTLSGVPPATLPHARAVGPHHACSVSIRGRGLLTGLGSAHVARSLCLFAPLAGEVMVLRRAHTAHVHVEHRLREVATRMVHHPRVRNGAGKVAAQRGFVLRLRVHVLGRARGAGVVVRHVVVGGDGGGPGQGVVMVVVGCSMMRPPRIGLGGATNS